MVVFLWVAWIALVRSVELFNIFTWRFEKGHQIKRPIGVAWPGDVELGLEIEGR